MSVFSEAADYFAVLSDPTRVQLLCLLRNGPLNVKSMSSALGTPQTLTSHHLACLRRNGLVTATRRGREVVYEVDDPMVWDVVNLVISLACSPARPGREGAQACH